MQGLFEMFETDTDKEQDGVNVSYGTNKDGTVPTFKISRTSSANTRWTKAVERETRPHRRLISLDELDAKTARLINMKVFVSAVLMGWDNVQDAEGQPISFTGENALKLFTKLPDLFDDLSAQANKASLFKKETAEADAKN